MGAPKSREKLRNCFKMLPRERVTWPVGSRLWIETKVGSNQLWRSWPRAHQASRKSRVPSSVLNPCKFSTITLAVHLFRIAQEAVSNATKHGHAKAVVVALESSDGIVSLRVSDDGIGFDPARSARRGMGLNIMRYRARMIGGTLEIQSNSPSGTVVVCTIERAPNARLNSNSTIHE